MYDRAPEGSAPFLLTPIPEDQWADMKQDSKTGSWTVTIPLKKGASRIDFFSNHGHKANGYQQYLSSPYTRVQLVAETYSKNQSKPAAAPVAVQRTQAEDEKLAVKGGGPDQETKEQFIKRVERNTKKSGQQLDRKSIEALSANGCQPDGIVTKKETARLNEAQTAPARATNIPLRIRKRHSPPKTRAQILKRFPQADTDRTANCPRRKSKRSSNPGRGGRQARSSPAVQAGDETTRR